MLEPANVSVSERERVYGRSWHSRCHTGKVDDFAVASPHSEAGEIFMNKIREHVEAEYLGMGISTPEGRYHRFNGLDVHQTRSYVRISCQSYLERVLQTHGWDTDDKQPSVNVVPLRPDRQEMLMNLEGPQDTSPEAKALERECGFPYKSVLGELIYPFVLGATQKSAVKKYCTLDTLVI